VIIGITGIWMSRLTQDISQWSLTWPVILSGVGLLFATLSTLAMGTLPEDQIGNASGLYNLFRNIGGAWESPWSTPSWLATANRIASNSLTT
jgi:DHA2 family multidrug resistance protein